MSSQPKRKIRRVRTGCITCRARKVKCDETAGGCNNCKHRQLLCDYVTSVPGSVDTTGPLSPRRLACQQCRIARCKCSHGKPRCSRCSLKQLDCAYPEPRHEAEVSLTPAARKRVTAAKEREEQSSLISSRTLVVENSHAQKDWRAGDSINAGQVGGQLAALRTTQVSSTDADSYINSPDQASSDLVEAPIREVHGGPAHINSLGTTSLPPNVSDYVDSFFEHVAPYQANGFLHRGMLKQQLCDGCASETILLAICAIAAPFLSLQQPVTPQANHWAQLSMQRLYSSSEITLKHAVAALILCKNASYNGAFNQAFMLASLANRYALKLRLFDETGWTRSDTSEVSWVEGEQRRRIMFSCYCVDRMTATGMRELTFCPAESMKIQLPCEDHNFDFCIPCTTPIPILEGEEDSSSGGQDYDTVAIMGHYVSLVGIRYLILRYMDSFSHSDPTVPWQPESDYQLALRKLAQWSNNLPRRFQLTRESIFGRHRTPQLGPLVMLHLWWDMLHCELYRLTLQTHSDPQIQTLFLTAPSGWVEQTQDRCLYHARNMVKILHGLKNDLGDDGLMILDPSLAMLCYASMKIQLLYAALQEPLSLKRNLTATETVDGFQILLMFVERLSRYFRHSILLLQEMKYSLQQTGVVGPWSESAIPASGMQTLDHPWLARLKQLDHQPTSPDLGISYYGMSEFENLLSEVNTSFFNPLMDLPDWLK